MKFPLILNSKSESKCECKAHLLCPTLRLMTLSQGDSVWSRSTKWIHEGGDKPVNEQLVPASFTGGTQLSDQTPATGPPAFYSAR